MNAPVLLQARRTNPWRLDQCWIERCLVKIQKGHNYYMTTAYIFKRLYYVYPTWERGVIFWIYRTCLVDKGLNAKNTM